MGFGEGFSEPMGDEKLIADAVVSIPILPERLARGSSEAPGTMAVFVSIAPSAGGAAHLGPLGGDMEWA